MALTGQLSDLSLAELIEFFCNQRKTGRLKVVYQDAPGYFYIQSGSLIGAKIGALSGVDAVYYSLSRPNASFKFNPAVEPKTRTINQPWAQVILEGLRRMDEGILIPSSEVFPNGSELYRDDPDDVNDSTEPASESVISDMNKGASAVPLSLTVNNADENRRKKVTIIGVVGAAVAVIIAAVAIPNSLSGRNKPPTVSAPVAATAPNVNPKPEAQPSSEANNPAEASAPQPETPAPTDPNSVASALAARREREARARERAKAAAEKTDASPIGPTITTSSSPAAGTETVKKTAAAKSGPRLVTVQVTYDESGRVTQASGGDGTALRIARQKRFPAGKAGSTTITIPIN